MVTTGNTPIASRSFVRETNFLTEVRAIVNSVEASASLELMTLSLITIWDFPTMEKPGKVTKKGVWGLNHRGWGHLIIKMIFVGVKL